MDVEMVMMVMAVLIVTKATYDSNGTEICRCACHRAHTHTHATRIMHLAAIVHAERFQTPGGAQQWRQGWQRSERPS